MNESVKCGEKRPKTRKYVGKNAKQTLDGVHLVAYPRCRSFARMPTPFHCGSPPTLSREISVVSSLFPAAAMLAAFQDAAPAAAVAPPPAIVGADTAWMLVSTALVLLMTPGVAFFYGGLVRAKNALNTMMMCMAAFGVCGVIWALLGYTLAFGQGGAYIGGMEFAFLRGVGLEAKGTIPHILFMAYQCSFAVVTA